MDKDSESGVASQEFVRQALCKCRRMYLGFCRSDDIKNLSDWDGRAYNQFQEKKGLLSEDSFKQIFKDASGKKRRVTRSSFNVLIRIFVDAGDLNDAKISAIREALKEYRRFYEEEDIQDLFEYVDNSIAEQTRFSFDIDSIGLSKSGNTGTIIDLWSDDVDYGGGLRFGIDVMFDTTGDERTPRLKRLRIEVVEPSWRWDTFYNFRQAEPAVIGQCRVKSVGVLSKPGWHIEPVDAVCFEPGTVHIVPAAKRQRAEQGTKVEVIAIAHPLDYYQRDELNKMDISVAQKAIVAHLDAKQAGEGRIASAWATVSRSYMGCRR